MRIDELLKENLIGKVFIDSEYSSKGDYEYYELIGVDYPGFDGVIIDIFEGRDADGDPMIEFKTTTGCISVYFGEDITLEEAE